MGDRIDSRILFPEAALPPVDDFVDATLAALDQKLPSAGILSFRTSTDPRHQDFVAGLKERAVVILQGAVNYSPETITSLATQLADVVYQQTFDSVVAQQPQVQQQAVMPPVQKKTEELPSSYQKVAKFALCIFAAGALGVLLAVARKLTRSY